MVVATYLAGQLIYRLRDIVLLMLLAGFVAMLLNPVVAKVQRRVPRRGLAVMIVTLWAALVFIGLAAAFGVPLVTGITHLADRMPGIELVTLFVLVLLLLLEGPKMWSWTLGQMTPGRQATVIRIAADVSGKVTGYIAGNLLTSLIAGVVVFVTLLVMAIRICPLTAAATRPLWPSRLVARRSALLAVCRLPIIFMAACLQIPGPGRADYLFCVRGRRL